MEDNRSHGKGAQLAEPAAAAAQRGGGPRSKHGKAISGVNALKSGIFSREIVIPEANWIAEGTQENYDRLLVSYVEHFKPEGPAERHQIEVAMGALWRYRRLLRAEVGETLNQERELDDSCNPDSNRSRATTRKRRASVPGSQESESLQRREEHLLRVYNRALSELARLQRPRLGDSPKAPIAVIIRMGRVTKRSGDTSDPQGAGPRNPKRAAIPESSLGEDQSLDQQATAKSRRPPKETTRDGLGRREKSTSSQPGHRS